MRFQSKFVAYTFLGLFMFTFVFQNMAAITCSFRIDLITVLNGKYLKIIHTPISDNGCAEENPFENETEDESETEVNPAEMTLNSSREISAYESVSSAEFFLVKNEHQPHDQPVYLVTRTFRI